MALTVSQGIAVSFNAVVNQERGKAANQWAESAFLREAEKQKMIVRKSLGPSIEETLDYQRNPGTVILNNELQPTSLTKTEVLTSANYTPAEIVAPTTWSKRDEALNPSENQKIALIKALIMNMLESHDDILEQALFATSTNGLLGLLTHIPTSGQGSDGGIDAATNVFWRNPSATYVDDTDIESAFTSVWNSCAKGSGSKLMPTLMASDGTTQAIFEGTQQANQRWVDTDELKAGFKILAFKTSRYVFSQYGTTSVFFTNPKNFRIIVSKEFFRQRGETQELQGASGYTTSMYSALQTVTNNKSRLGVAHL